MKDYEVYLEYTDELDDDFYFDEDDESLIETLVKQYTDEMELTK